jgi:hypothetical protein
MGGMSDRMAAPLAAGQRKLVDLAVVVEPFTGGYGADDLDRLAGASDGPIEPDAMPALHDLRPAGADAQYEPTPRQRLQRMGRHREHRRRTGAELHDAGRQPDCRGLPGEVAERGEGITGPELGDPHGVHPEPVGLADELDGRRASVFHEPPATVPYRRFRVAPPHQSSAWVGTPNDEGLPKIRAHGCAAA